MENQSLEINDELKTMAFEVLLEEYSQYANVWLSTATKNEIKGLKVVNAVVKHEGKKRFKPRKKAETLNSGNSAEQLRKKYMNSYYNSEYCLNAKKSQSETEIFKYKKLNELRCSSVIRKNVLLYLEKWLLTGDEEHYQSLMLSFLRGIYSVIKTQTAVPSSSHRENFEWVKIAGVRREVKNLSVEKPVVEAKKNNRTQSTGDQPFPAIGMQNPMGHRLRNLQGLKGNGEITSWISYVPNINSSLYQDSFAVQFSKKAPVPKNDFHTSIVFRLLPNKY